MNFEVVANIKLVGRDRELRSSNGSVHSISADNGNSQ